MKKNEGPEEPRPRGAGFSPTSFLLAQVGAHAASQFAQRLGRVQLAPRHAGILRLLNSNPATTQQALAATLNMVPSQLVAVVDEMEERGLIERRTNPDDRRSYALHITEKGRSTLQEIGGIAREHAQALLAALSQEEQTQLGELLQRVADQQGLTRGVHPGYRAV